MVDLSRQHRALRREVDKAIEGVLRSGAFVGGHHVESFERSFAEYCGAAHCIGVGNCTDALTIALKALGIGAGDEVIVPATSFFATAEAVSNSGARVRFCDIDWSTCNIDPNELRRLITANTKAIVPVHLYGQPADMNAIMTIAKEHGLRVVEDCAQAVGARYGGARVGTIGDIGCFSFYPSKNLGALGDAGAIVTNDADLADACRRLANHGGLKRYSHDVIGYNSRLDAIQAAVLSVKLPYVDEWNRQRAEIAKRYRTALTEVEHLAVAAERVHVYHLYVVRTDRRDAVLESLRRDGIAADVHYPTALPCLAPYRADADREPEAFPHARKHAARALSVPIFPYMTEAEIERIAKSRAWNAA